MLDQKNIEWLIHEVFTWITKQRNQFIEKSRILNTDERQKLLSFFDDSTINSARLQYVDIIENPPFYKELNHQGINNLINFNNMAGITFRDCILLTERLNDPHYSVLFHELVHVVQYEILGIESFAKEYVLGWINNGFDYYKIPLETQAYLLQENFDKKSQPFSVNNFIKKKIEEEHQNKTNFERI